MRIAFITTNKHKFQEVQDILKDYPIELEHLSMEYEENHDFSIEEIARSAAKKLAEKLKRPVVVEDTGLFFEAYPGFPGALPKFVFNALGYAGILKLLKAGDRRAYFKAVVGFCEPSQSPALFKGTMKGNITEEVYDIDKDVMVYDRIFIPKGKDQVISKMSLKEKNSFSHRRKAFLKFGEYIVKRTKNE